jgi:hypothetical protein
MHATRHPVLIGLLALVLSATLAAAAEPGTALLERVRVLASPELDGRGNGTPAARSAADSIDVWFASAGLVAPPGGETRFRTFRLEDADHAGREGVNVLGWLPGVGDLAGEVVVIGAHYDHLGPHYDADGRRDGYHPGAEDNASGVSVLIEIAGRRAASAESPRRSLLVVAFAGEEIGLQGSRALLREWPAGVGRPVAMLNLDSVGRLRDERLYVGGLGSSPRWRGLIETVNRTRGLTLELSQGGWDASDHVAFNAEGVPVLFFFTGPHPQYHSRDDRWELVDPSGLASVAAFVDAVLADVLTDKDGFPYAAQSELPSVPRTAGGTERAWLGTIPDFVESVDGVRLAGVMPGSPAEESGLVEGDLIIAVAGEAVHGLPDLTRILYANPPGETVDVVLLNFRATLRPRRR